MIEIEYFNGICEECKKPFKRKLTPSIKSQMKWGKKPRFCSDSCACKSRFKSKLALVNKE
jgi:hypothetical protein